MRSLTEYVFDTRLKWQQKMLVAENPVRPHVGQAIQHAAQGVIVEL